MKNNALINKVALVFGIVMGIVYIGVGVLIYFGDFLYFQQAMLKNALGILFVLYGIFRFYRVYKKYSEQIEETNNEDEN